MGIWIMPLIILMAESQSIPVISMKFYPSYFDADQLFDLTADPYEQKNLAYDPEYAEKADELKEVLKAASGNFSASF